jgi:hypothetical protein
MQKQKVAPKIKESFNMIVHNSYDSERLMTEAVEDIYNLFD